MCWHCLCIRYEWRINTARQRIMTSHRKEQGIATQLHSSSMSPLESSLATSPISFSHPLRFPTSLWRTVYKVLILTCTRLMSHLHHRQPLYFIHALGSDVSVVTYRFTTWYYLLRCDAINYKHMFKHEHKLFLNNFYVLYKSMTYNCGVYAYRYALMPI